MIEYDVTLVDVGRYDLPPQLWMTTEERAAGQLCTGKVDDYGRPQWEQIEVAIDGRVSIGSGISVLNLSDDLRGTLGSRLA